MSADVAAQRSALSKAGYCGYIDLMDVLGVCLRPSGHNGPHEFYDRSIVMGIYDRLIVMGIGGGS